MRSLFRLVIFALLLLAGFISAQRHTFVPGKFKDPYLVKAAGYHLFYATPEGDERYYKEAVPLVWTSFYFNQWRAKPIEGLKFEDYKYPSVIRGEDKKFYLYTNSSKGNYAEVRVSDKPWGPFGEPTKINAQYLRPFKDPRSGKYYLTTKSTKVLELDNNPNSPTYLRKVIDSFVINIDHEKITGGTNLFYYNKTYYFLWTEGSLLEYTSLIRYAKSSSLKKAYKQNPDRKELNDNLIAFGGNASTPFYFEIDGKPFMFTQSASYRAKKKINDLFKRVYSLDFSAPSFPICKLVKDLGNKVSKKSTYPNVAFKKPVVQMPVNTLGQPLSATDGSYNIGWKPVWDKPGGNVLTVGLEKKHFIQNYEVIFEYPEHKYRCKITYSRNYKKWWDYADFSKKPEYGYKIMEATKGKKTAKYVRVEVWPDPEGLPVELAEIRAFGEERLEVKKKRK